MNKKNIIASLIIISFILLVASALFFMQKYRESRQIDPLELEDLSKEDIIQLIYERRTYSNNLYLFLIPMFGFFGVVIGLLIYYVMTADIEKKEHIIDYNTDVILKLLNPEERKVIKKIVGEGGKVQQMEITYMEGFTKVKSHRILDSLVKKSILSKEKLGKQRLVKMNPEFYEILRKK